MENGGYAIDFVQQFYIVYPKHDNAVGWRTGEVYQTAKKEG
jgi:hypothetical protein